MEKLKKIMELNIREYANGEEVGKVWDVAFSSNLHKITSIILESGKLIKEKWVVPFNNIISFDDDILSIKKNDITKLEEINREEIILSKDIGILGKEIMMEDGEVIGYVRDVMVNPSDGMVIGFTMTEGIFEDIFNGQNFIPYLGNVKIDDKKILVDKEIMIQIAKNKDYYKKLLGLRNE